MVFAVSDFHISSIFCVLNVSFKCALALTSLIIVLAADVASVENCISFGQFYINSRPAKHEEGECAMARVGKNTAVKK